MGSLGGGMYALKTAPLLVLILVPGENWKCIINYNFLFVRMLQCLNMSEHYKWFPMLKSKAKVRALDEIWKGMCKSMGVEYVPLPSFKSLR